MAEERTKSIGEVDKHSLLFAAARDSNPLFQPIRVGRMQLSHRVILAPLTRCRALNGIPQLAHVEYYRQRATLGGLVITEATSVSSTGHGYPHTPGIYTKEQIKAWKKVVDAVHTKGAFIYIQLWHVGRASHPCHQPNGENPISSTNKAIPKPHMAMIKEHTYVDYPNPRVLERHEMPNVVKSFRSAARNAIIAGFDGVEIHSAHGYLLDQFLKDGINDRTDEYGGPIKNRCRLTMEVVENIVEEIGSDQTGVRISPIIDHNGARDSDPEALGVYLIRMLNSHNLAYLQVTEPRFHYLGIKQTSLNCQKFRDACTSLFMATGGYTRASGMEAIKSGYADLISYGRLFIANPDLPSRFALDSELNAYDRKTFYAHDQVVGYVDYPFLSESTITEGEIPMQFSKC